MSDLSIGKIPAKKIEFNSAIPLQGKIKKVIAIAIVATTSTTYLGGYNQPTKLPPSNPNNIKVSIKPKSTLSVGSINLLDAIREKNKEKDNSKSYGGRLQIYSDGKEVFSMSEEVLTYRMVKDLVDGKAETIMTEMKAGFKASDAKINQAQKDTVVQIQKAIDNSQKEILENKKEKRRYVVNIIVVFVAAIIGAILKDLIF